MDLFHDHPRFESELYIIRAPRAEEVDSLFPLGLTAWEGKSCETIEEARASIRKTGESFAAGECLHWIIESKATQQIVGAIGFYRGFKDGWGEIGYVISPSFRGKKIMTEILPRVLEFAFKVKGLTKVIAITKADNPASVNLLQRFGFRLEMDLSEGRLQFGRAVR